MFPGQWFQRVIFDDAGGYDNIIDRDIAFGIFVGKVDLYRISFCRGIGIHITAANKYTESSHEEQQKEYIPYTRHPLSLS
jgi:hypothetical protein